MCGIAGIVADDASLDLVAQMTSALGHRGPDGSGVWAERGVALGHRRLKIIDLSDRGRQPMSTPDGRFTIIYNGEVYNHEELRRELRDVRFQSESDTEVILQAFARWGPACLERFIGMFAIAIWDSRDRTLFCARDRLGIKPFYYASDGGRFVFGSEIRALLTAGIRATVNDRVLYDFLARDFYEHTDDTFFKDVRSLPPGTWIKVSPGRVSVPTSYWDLREATEEVVVASDPREREEQLVSLLLEAVRLHLRSDVPVAVALSGGLDSATLLKLLDVAHDDPSIVEAFSFSFNDPTYSERPFVEIMARDTNRRAHFAEITEQLFVNQVREVSLQQEQPFAGLPIVAYTECYREARDRGFVVVMDGSGVDEALAGYTRFRPARWADLFLSGDTARLDRELSAAGISDTAGRMRALAQMQAAAGIHADIGKGQDLTTSVRPDCLTRDLAASSYPKPHFDRPFDSSLKNLMYRELRYTKLPRALRFRDRLSMAHGTELRPPFLDHRVLAFAFALPAEDLVAEGASKAILRRAASRLLPDAVRLASKRSVQTPQREWFRGVLSGWVREQIDSPRFWQRGWIDRTRGRAAMEAFLKGEGDNSFFLWQWMNLEMWAEQSLDSHPDSVSETAALTVQLDS